MNNELTALQNAVNSTKVENLTIHEKYSDDKRKKVKKYFLQYGKATISPTLDYDNMNHFILGFNRAKEVLITFKNNYQ